MTVLIVDDTPIIREGLRKIISLNCPDYQVVGEAADGEAGLRSLIELVPDVCIVDMKMPKMDGVEMVRRARESKLITSFIVLSGYADFNYAKSMIGYGCYGYLLKPVNHRELISLLDALAQEYSNLQQAIVPSRKDVGQVDRARVEAEAVKNCCEGKLTKLDELMLPMQFKTIVEESAVIGIFHLNRPSPMLSGSERLGSGEGGEEKAGNGILIQLVDHVRLLLAKEPNLRSYCAQLNSGEFMCMLGSISDQTRIETIIRSTCQAMKKIHGVTFTVGLAGNVFDLASVNQAYNKAREALDQCFYDSLISVRWYADSGTPDGIPLFFPIEQQLFRNLAMENHQGVVEKFSELVDLLKKYVVPKKHCHLILNRVYGTLRKVLAKQNNQYLLDALPTMAIFEQQIFPCERMEALDLIIDLILQQLIEFEELDKGDDLKKNATIRKVLRYMDQNYQSGLSLDEVSAVAHMTSSYFSTYFKKTTGENYLVFATRMKIEKAKELLQNPSIHIYEVSEKVGFDDSKYFSRQFHKLTGMTPKQYRDSVIS
jgi:two-component system response regulator YesN